MVLKLFPVNTHFSYSYDSCPWPPLIPTITRDYNNCLQSYTKLLCFYLHIVSDYGPLHSVLWSPPGVITPSLGNTDLDNGHWQQDLTLSSWCECPYQDSLSKQCMARQHWVQQWLCCCGIFEVTNSILPGRTLTWSETNFLQRILEKSTNVFTHLRKFSVKLIHRH